MATRQWAVTTNGTYDFNGAANWQFGVVPDVVDIAQFNTGALDTITGTATIAEILVSAGTAALSGTYTISGAQPTELSITSGALTILSGALVNGNQAVSVSGVFASLEITGTLVASSLTVTGGNLLVDAGSAFDVAGPIALNNSAALIAKPAPNSNPGAPVAIANAIQTSGTVLLTSRAQQELDLNGVISGSGLVDFNSDSQVGDTVAVNGNNTYTGGAVINTPNVTVAAGNANAFGTGTLTIAAGEVLATTTETIANKLAMTPAFTIAAAHNQTLTIGTGAWTLTPNNLQAITFGAPGQDGTVIFKDTGGATINPGSYGVIVQAGTLKSGGDTGVLSLVDSAFPVTVQAGATLDSAGFGMTLGNLSGGGRVTNSGGLATLFVTAGIPGFFGVIDGAFTVTISVFANLTGNNTYTGGTTITNTGQLLLGFGTASGSVTGTITDNGSLAIGRSDAITLNNVSGTGSLSEYGPGTTTLGSGINYSGGTNILGGTLAVGNPTALGSGNLTINGFNVDGINPSGNAELLGTATETIFNPGTVTLNGNSTIAAAHGTTLTINPATLTYNANAITIGAAGQDGTVSFLFGNHPSNSASVSNPGAYTVTIQAGTLKTVDGTDTAILLGNDTATLIQSGAALDMGGFSFNVANLQGGGSVTNSGAAAALTLIGSGTFSGVINAPLSVTVLSGADTFAGNNTYTGTTTINPGTALSLGNGAASGSVAGGIVDSGTLHINRSDTFALNNVSGSGKVTQDGPGTTILGSGLAYSGGTTIDAGVLSVGNPTALGSGALTLTGGELLASATETIGNQLIMSGNFNIAAAHGQTLTTSSSQAWSLTANLGEMINFGAAGQDGVVVFKDTSSASITNTGLYTVSVQAGTLKAGDGGLLFLLGNDLATVVQSGATLDAAGFNLSVNGLQGGGHIGNSGAAATLFVGGGDFAGNIDGPLTLQVSAFTNLTLTGANTYTGGTTVNLGAELSLGNGGSTGSISGNITDNGALEFHLNSTTVESGTISGSGNVVQDGSGTTVLTAANNYSGGTLLGGGTLELQQSGSAGSGTITFLGGAASTLRIDGTAMPSNAIVNFAAGGVIDLPNLTFNGTSYSGGVLTLKNNGTTVGQLNLASQYSAPLFAVAPDGSGGDEVKVFNLNELLTDAFQPARTSDILLHNLANGQDNNWVMSNSQIAQNLDIGSADPTQWQIAGTGDFNGDGTADILLRNSANGQFNVWQMSNDQIAQNTMIGVADPTQWQTAGTGDFFGLGTADILLRNAVNGQVNIWQMGNGQIVANLDLGMLDPTQWRIAGTGDFNGNGTADILLHNSMNGQFNIWEMSNGQIAQNLDIGAADPTQWQVAGTGDFYGNGTDDILLRNSANGQVNIWQMSNGQLVQNTDLGFLDPTQWQIAGTGDFNSDGTDDILLRNAVNGQVNIWQMSNGQIAQNLDIGAADPTQWQIDEAGVDLVTAPAGSATLDALAAHTVFDFSAGTFGNDTVVGFDDQQDQFLIGHTLAANFAAIQADESSVGASTLITFNAGQSILVSGVTPSGLMADNFHFV